jgi:hypothetical protein
MTIHELQRTPWRLLHSAAGWHVTSQQQSRRNALVASTALVQRRRELAEVDEFLAHLETRREAASGRAARHTA